MTSQVARHQDFEKRLQMDAGDLLDCRNADAPKLEIELFEGKASRWAKRAAEVTVGMTWDGDELDPDNFSARMKITLVSDI